MVISTPTVSYNTPLVWYAHFIFYSVAVLASYVAIYGYFESACCDSYVMIIMILL